MLMVGIMAPAVNRISPVQAERDCAALAGFIPPNAGFVDVASCNGFMGEIDAR
jgi:hypothetical protein